MYLANYASAVDADCINDDGIDAEDLAQPVGILLADNDTRTLLRLMWAIRNEWNEVDDTPLRQLKFHPTVEGQWKILDGEEFYGILTIRKVEFFTGRFSPVSDPQ